MSPDVAVDAMVEVLWETDQDVLISSLIDESGFVRPGDVFSLRCGAPSGDVLFHLPKRMLARGVMFASKAHDDDRPDLGDLVLAQTLLRAGREQGISVWEHVLVTRAGFRLLSGAKALWTPGEVDSGM